MIQKLLRHILEVKKMALLEVKDLQVYYGVIQALKGISFEVNEGEIVTLIGANGAGKTTTMQSIIGLIPSQGGTVTFDGMDITKMPCHKIVRSGLTQVPEGRRIFQELTVYENLLMGGFSQKDQSVLKKDIEGIYERFPRLFERKNQIAGTLSGGEQQMLAIGRALMGSPKLLILDEPSLGLAPLLIKDIFETLKKIKAEGTTILIVEQNALATLKIADYAYVLELGKISMHGKSSDLLKDKRLVEAYLGGK
jgi:branched-chain amino acid transport system ATP-binding protein